MSSPLAVEVESAPKAILGESPLWLPKTGSLMFIDINGHRLHRYSPVSKTAVSMSFEKPVGFAVPSSSCSTICGTSREDEDNVFSVGLDDRIVEVDLDKSTILRTLAMVPPHLVNEKTRFNDGKCSIEGTLFAGYMHSDWRSGCRGNLLQLVFDSSKSTSVKEEDEEEKKAATPSSKKQKIAHDGDGNADATTTPADVPPICSLMEVEIGAHHGGEGSVNGVHLPNGSAWTDKHTMYFVDSGAAEIWKLTFASDSIAESRVEKKEVVYTLPQAARDAGHMMDGMTIDTRGYLWVAVPGGGCVICVDPQRGEEVQRVQVPNKKPTACTFGGEDLGDLYITTRNESPTEKDPVGALYVARIAGVNGAAPAVTLRLP